MANQIVTIEWIEDNHGLYGGGATIKEKPRCPTKSEILTNVENVTVTGTYDDDQCVRQEDIVSKNYTYTVVNNTSYSLYLFVDNVNYGLFAQGISTFETETLFTSSSNFSAETTGAPYFCIIDYNQETMVITLSEDGSGSSFLYFVNNETSENVEVTFTGKGVSGVFKDGIDPGICDVTCSYYLPGVSDLSLRCVGHSSGYHYMGYVADAAGTWDYDAILVIQNNIVETSTTEL